MNSFTYQDYKLFRDEPHLFGKYLGYEDLIETHTEWIKDGWINKTPSLQAHRNSYKTTALLIVGFLWFNIFIDQDKTVLFIRKAREEVWKIIKAVKNHLESRNIEYILRELELVKANAVIKTDNWSNGSITLATKKTVTPEGSLDGIGMGGSITGSHYDYIFPDDIITLKDRVSKAERESTKDYIRELRNIKKNDGKIFFSGTPWHKDDGWSIIPEPKVYPIGTVPIKGYTEEALENKMIELKSGTTSSLYCANYELKHIASEDVIFEDPIYGSYPPLENIKKCIAYLDPAYSGSNTTALTVLCVTKESEYYVTGFVWIESVEKIYQQIADKLRIYNVGTLYEETNADKGLSRRDLLNYFPNVVPRHEKENKHVRIIGYAKKHWNDLIFDTKIQPEYINQILDYVEGEEPDDAPDSLAGAIREIFGQRSQAHFI